MQYIVYIVFQKQTFQWLRVTCKQCWSNRVSYLMGCRPAGAATEAQLSGLADFEHWVLEWWRLLDLAMSSLNRSWTAPSLLLKRMTAIQQTRLAWVRPGQRTFCLLLLMSSSPTLRKQSHLALLLEVDVVVEMLPIAVSAELLDISQMGRLFNSLN